MQMIEQFREWQRQNPDWELVCDMPSEAVDALYVQWSELSKAERMSWIGSYGRSGRDAFEEVGIKRCKVPHMVLGADMELHDITDWPHGEAMTVYQTNAGLCSHEQQPIVSGVTK